ncbi:A-kinase anchor protein 7 isoform X1 [Biomphalaria glabrata]|nr:A-kinase anchor protein 7 isoform X1 [Biomphalaria glabrata]
MEKLVENDSKIVEKCSSFNTQVCVDGKRHVLPTSLLLNLKTWIQEQHSQIVKQIIEDNILSCIEKDVDKGQQCTSDDSIYSDILDNTVEDIQEKVLSKPSNDPLPCNEDLQDNGKYNSVTRANSSFQKPVKCADYADSNRKANALKRESVDSPTNQPKSKKKRPNYFVAVQITDPEIHEVAKKVQTAIQSSYDFNIDLAMVGSEKFHITLMVMHLANQEEVERASAALEKCVSTILVKTSGQQVKLQMEGVSAFGGGRVVFAGLKPSHDFDHLHFMSDEVHKNMAEEGIFTTDTRSEFNPHMTLVKFNGDRKLLKLGFKKVSAEKYEPFLHQVFGSQSVASLQLCSMNKKREDGYYFVNHEVFFHKAS